jgi:hypothetical protein
MVDPTDLVGFPGAPFTDAQVDAAVDEVRTAAGWHIAPLRTGQTVTLDVERRESWLRLPTRKLASVDEVRDPDSGDAIDADTYRTSLLLAQVKRSGCYWPCGYAAVEVDMTHGYTTCPASVLAVVALACNLAKRDPTVREVAIDDFSVTRNTDATQAALKAALGITYVLDDSLYGIGIA